MYTHIVIAIVIIIIIIIIMGRNWMFNNNCDDS